MRHFINPTEATDLPSSESSGEHQTLRKLAKVASNNKIDGAGK